MSKNNKILKTQKITDKNIPLNHNDFLLLKFLATNKNAVVKHENHTNNYTIETLWPERNLVIIRLISDYKSCRYRIEVNDKIIAAGYGPDSASECFVLEPGQIKSYKPSMWTCVAPNLIDERVSQLFTLVRHLAFVQKEAQKAETASIDYKKSLLFQHITSKTYS